MTTQGVAPKPPVGYRPPWETSRASQTHDNQVRPNQLTPEERARRSKVRKAAPRCPLRPGEPCTLCQPFVTGPQDCQTVRVVMEDPELRAILAEKRRAYNERIRARRAQNAD
ncbi:MAG: hypothetical protein Q4D87_04055 [Actinomycetaceae bacterium]|nr:hypothetical protein [Actinomycetaceae bacterium]